MNGNRVARALAGVVVCPCSLCAEVVWGVNDEALETIGSAARQGAEDDRRYRMLLPSRWGRVGFHTRLLGAG